jgi:ketosteroid isomerase-like protein
MAFTGPLEDRVAIRELIDAYSDAVNRVDAAAWGDCWAEDSMWEMPDYPEWGRKEGRGNIVALWVEAMKTVPGLIMVANPGSIEVTGDTARVTTYTSEVYDRDGVTKRDRGRYEDVCVKRGGRWLFESRSFRNIHRDDT